MTSESAGHYTPCCSQCGDVFRVHLNVTVVSSSLPLRDKSVKSSFLSFASMKTLLSLPRQQSECYTTSTTEQQSRH